MGSLGSKGSDFLGDVAYFHLVVQLARLESTNVAKCLQRASGQVHAGHQD
jgi:hypothetical protein